MLTGVSVDAQEGFDGSVQELLSIVLEFLVVLAVVAGPVGPEFG